MTLAPARPNFVLSQINLLRATHPDIWDDEELRALALASETSLHDFMTGLVGRMRLDRLKVIGLDAMIDATINEMGARKRRFQTRVEAQRELARKIMENAGLRKLELAEATLSIRTGPRKVIITDEAALPDNLMCIKRKPNKTLIKELIEQGVPIAGATLSNAEETLTMGRK